MDQGPVSIVFKRKGTIVLEGQAIVRDEDGNVVALPVFKQQGVVKFCGCGRSQNKPFCDGSHKRIPGEQPGEGVKSET